MFGMQKKALTHLSGIRLKEAGVYFIFFLWSLLKMAHCGTIPDVKEYWPEVSNDVSRVTWSHATNSKQLLDTALNNDTIMMIEADVLLGRLQGTPLNSPPQPIMAHPPLHISDLSLQEFLSRVLQATQDGKRKGIKLDFKELRVLNESLSILVSYNAQLTFPVWLNADILSGPVEATAVPLDADTFLSSCSDVFPEATLSVGWTTRFTSANDSAALYSEADVQAMTYALLRNNVTQPLTFPIRAAFVGRSMDALKQLITYNNGSTITVWSSESDTVDISSLVTLQTELGAAFVYYDLPPDQMAEFDNLKPGPDGSTPSVASVRVFAGVGLVLGAVTVALLVPFCDTLL